MNIDLLIKMTNEIGEFFAGAADAQQAPRDVANHLKRYWEPRMRAQMIAYYEQRQGAGLTDLAKSGVALLVEDSKAAGAAGAASQGGTSRGAKA
jgi:formate dehydrogenase subunit delta